jgi:hypothetical protein
MILASCTCGEFSLCVRRITIRIAALGVGQSNGPAPSSLSRFCPGCTTVTFGCNIGVATPPGARMDLARCGYVPLPRRDARWPSGARRDFIGRSSTPGRDVMVALHLAVWGICGSANISGAPARFTCWLVQRHGPGAFGSRNEALYNGLSILSYREGHLVGSVYQLCQA